MEELPIPREDGYCCDCDMHNAVTTDRRFCRECLRRRVRMANPLVKTIINEMLDRKTSAEPPTHMDMTLIEDRKDVMAFTGGEFDYLCLDP